MRALTSDPTPGGSAMRGPVPRPASAPPGVPGRPAALVAYGRDRLWDLRRRLKAELCALRPARHPHATDQAARFEALYADELDPFHYTTADYERRKYDLCVAMLPNRPIGSAYEPGCSIGELTVRLAPYCDELLASDVSEEALQRARQRTRGYDNITYERHLLPRDHPVGPFDLVVMGELGYYLEPPALHELIGRMAATVAPGGYLLAVHGRGVSRDIYHPGDIVHRHQLLETGLRRAAAYREEAFRIELLQRS